MLTNVHGAASAAGPVCDRKENKFKMTRVAINGFGRIGRLSFRKIFGDSRFEVVAINDLTKPDMLAYLLKYDTIHGTFDHNITCTEESILVDGVEIPIYKEPDARNLPWAELDVDIVLECSGYYTSTEKSQAHLDAGAKKVLISAPAGNDLPTIVYGINHETLTPEDRIVSGASCTTNCLAPIAKALNKYREIRSGFMTTIHAYTADQKIQDGPHPKGDFRRARAGAQNIVPNSTGAAKAIGLVIPELQGKLTGNAQRVPVITGSLTILDAVVYDPKDCVATDTINRAMLKASSESFGYTEDPIVSSDVIGCTFGSLFDATQTLAMPCGEHLCFVRVVAWYDNEMSYTNQLIRTLNYMGSLGTPGEIEALDE